MASWKASWKRRRTEKEAQGEAEATRLIEEARADARRQMIATITETLQQLPRTDSPVPPRMIALRFIAVLEELAESQPVQELLPENVQGIPARLRILVERTNSGDDGEESR